MAGLIPTPGDEESEGLGGGLLSSPSTKKRAKKEKGGAGLFGRSEPKEELPTEPKSHFWETAKGAGRGLIDLLSRPGYAAVGAAEEIFSPQGQGVAYAPVRAAQELLSGVGPIKGEKRSASEVLERAGVSELGKLSDLLPIYNETGEGPALKRGGAFDPTLRGTVGLAGDIFLDPTTYVTMGGAAARKFLTKEGTKFLSPEGMKIAASIRKTFEPDIKVALGLSDDVARNKLRSAIDEAYRAEVLAATKADPKLLDKTGLKIFGQEVVSPETLKGLSDTAKQVVTSVPGGAAAARGADALSRGIQRTFDKFADLQGLPAQERDAFKGMMRENASAAASHKTALYAKWNVIANDYKKLAKTLGRGDEGRQALGKRFTEWRQSPGTVTPTAAEAPVFKALADFYDEMEPILVREGIITPEQAASHMGGYLHQRWKNTDEALQEVVNSSGRGLNTVPASEDMQKARQFANVKEGVEISRRLHEKAMQARAAGFNVKTYGDLIPEYDVIKNLGDYISQSTSAIWRKRTYDEAARRFGHVVDYPMQSAIYDLSPSITMHAPTRAAIDKAVQKAETLGMKNFDDFRTAIKGLSHQEQKEAVKELFQRVTSPSQALRIEDEFGSALMPSLKATAPGSDAAYYARYGLDGTPVTVKGGLWGDKELKLPAQIVKMVEEAPRDFLMDAAKKVKLQGFLKAYDRYNNMFKAITYPGYPSGAVRDIYNNVMQSYLGIGVGAFARPTQALRLLKGDANDILRLGEREFTAKELNALAKDLGVVDPSAASFVQFTGEEGAKQAGLLAKARAKRGSVDNWTRSQLFINSIAQGMTPEDSAQLVKDFLFDYSELSHFDKDIMRRLMPFYVFPRKAIESYGRAAIKTPGRVINVAKPFRGREDENNTMTTWEGEGFKVRLDRNGKDVTMLNGVDLPVRTLDTLWAGSPIKTMNKWLSMASPALKVPYMMTSGQDPFRQQEMTRQQMYALGPLMEDAPRWAKEWVGFQKETDKAGRPKYTLRTDRVQVLAEMTLLSRVLSTSERAFREQVRQPNMAARWLDYLTGLRYKTLNLDEENTRRLQTLERIAQEEAVRQGEAKEFRRVYQPKEK